MLGLWDLDLGGLDLCGPETTITGCGTDCMIWVVVYSELYGLSSIYFLYFYLTIILTLVMSKENVKGYQSYWSFFVYTYINYLSCLWFTFHLDLEQDTRGDFTT